MQQRFLRFSLILSLLVMVLGGVWFQQATPAQSQTPATLKIGYIGTANDDTALGIRLAITQLNGAGGITAADGQDYLYELVISEAITPEQVPTAIRLLTEEGVVAIFGPDSNPLITIPENLTALSTAAVPVIIGATDDAILGQDTNGNIFRAVAPERMYSIALAKYLVEVREFSRIAIIRQGAQWESAAIGLRFILNQELSVDPVLVVEGETSEDVAARNADLLTINPEAVVMYGDADATLAMYTQLRTSNWQGIFVYRTPQEPFVGELIAGVISADTWTFGAPETLSATFVAQFAAEFGTVPQPLAASGYDTFFALNAVLRDVGIDPVSVRTGLDQLEGIELVRGTVSGTFDERNLSMTAYIYELNGHGGERQLAIYDNGELRPDSLAPVGGAVVVVQPTTTPLPTATTIAATATPNFLIATVDNPVLNVRSGPGTEYEKIGELEDGDQVRIIGRNDDFSWFLIQDDNLVGWVSAEFVDVFDPGNLLATLPVVPAPATPTPGATALSPDPDLVITGVSYTPSTPQPNCPFNATVTVINQGGGNAGGFSVATTFIPTDASTQTGTTVPSLNSGQSTNVNLSKTIANTTYVPSLAYVVDLNREVDEGTNGESNNEFVRNFKVDYPNFVENTVTLTSGSSLDLHGGSEDLSWDGSNFTMSGTTAKIGVFTTGDTYETVHYGQVAGVATASLYNNPLPNVVLGVITAEGHYGVIGIISVSGGSVQFIYRVYNNSAPCPA